MIVRITRVKVGNRQAPHATNKNPTPKRWGFCVGACSLQAMRLLSQALKSPHVFQNHGQCRRLPMLRLSEIKLALDHPESAIEPAVHARLAEIGVDVNELVSFHVFRRAHDARKRSDIKLTYIIDVELQDEASVLKRLEARPHPHVAVTPDMTYRFVAQAPARSSMLRPVVIGMGPCGLFAGLILAQMGFRPIILERGKAVRERTKDTWGLWRKNELNPESNVQFGEGGAGTFSDGKLYSQIKDPKHYGRKVLDEFVKAGAPDDILYLSRPHIGTFRLVSMVEKMRANIEELGGEVRFETRVEDIEIDQGKVRAL